MESYCRKSVNSNGFTHFSPEIHLTSKPLLVDELTDFHEETVFHVL